MIRTTVNKPVELIFNNAFELFLQNKFQKGIIELKDVNFFDSCYMAPDSAPEMLYQFSNSFFF